MPPRNGIVLVDTNAIQAAHAHGCWNALRRNYRLHSVLECVEEATRPNKGAPCALETSGARFALTREPTGRVLFRLRGPLRAGLFRG